MKYYWLATFCILAMACVSESKPEEKKLEKRKTDHLLEEVFNSKYSNYKDNQLVREQAAKELDKRIDSIIVLGGLDDVPLKIFTLRKNPYGKGALVHFYTDNHGHNNSDLLSNRVDFDLLGFMDESLAATLNDKGTYLVYAKKYKRLNNDAVFAIVSQVYHSPETNVVKDAVGEVYNFNIGNILCEVDSIVEIKK